MTPKEKAKELFDKYYTEVLDRDGTSAMNGFEAKQCALIAVDELLLLITYQPTIDYWNEVKQEIEKL
jgi:hypothetical protein